MRKRRETKVPNALSVYTQLGLLASTQTQLISSALSAKFLLWNGSLAAVICRCSFLVLPKEMEDHEDVVRVVLTDDLSALLSTEPMKSCADRHPSPPVARSISNAPHGFTVGVLAACWTAWVCGKGSLIFFEVFVVEVMREHCPLKLLLWGEANIKLARSHTPNKG